MPFNLFSDAHNLINNIVSVPINYIANWKPRKNAWNNQQGKKILCFNFLTLTFRQISRHLIYIYMYWNINTYSYVHFICPLCTNSMATVVNFPLFVSTMTKQATFSYGISCAIIAFLLSFLIAVTESPSEDVCPNQGNIGVWRHALTRNWFLQQITLDSSIPLWSRATDWLTMYTISNTRYDVDLSSNVPLFTTPSTTPFHVHHTGQQNIGIKILPCLHLYMNINSSAKIRPMHRHLTLY